MKQYTREFLLSFAEKQDCRRLPGDLDPALSRDNPSPEIVDGGKSASRREQQEVPDWRSRNSTNGGGGLLSHQSRRKSHEEEGYVPRGPSSWGGEGSNVRNKPGSQGPVQTRWDQRSDRDRDKSSRGPQTEGPEQGDSGSRPRFAWNGSEHDGLLGSGGGLRGAYPGGRAPDRYNNVGGRGTRNNDPRSNKPSAGYRNEADTLDGETFGDKISTKDRAEEERRRREEFEAMRKEQHGNKEKKPEKVDDGASVDDHSPSSAVSEPKPDVSTAPAIISTPRPLVPPGFSQTSLQKLVKNDLKEEVVKEHSESSSNPQRILQSVDATVAEGDLFALEDNFRVNAIDKLFSKASSSSALLSSSHKSEKLETRTSKFAHLFSVDDESSILSLLSSPPAANKQRAGNSPRSPVSTTSEVKPSSEGGHMLPMPVAPSLEDVEKGLGREAVKNFSATGTPSSSSQQPGKPFLTCEDIEQSLLAEVKYDNQATEYSSWKKEPDADSNASRHLLSLLQKPSSNEPVKAAEQVNEGQRGSDTGVPTLESLFGTSFMMELRSKDAPLSAKAVSDTSNSMLQLPTKNDAPASAVDFQARMLNESGPKVVDGHSGHHRWASLWSGKPEKPRDRLASQLMSFDEIRNSASASEVDKSYQEFNTRDRLGFYQENGESARLTDPSSYVSYASEAGIDSSARNQPREELDSGVLNDFLKFKKAMKHRNKVNDSFLGMIEGGNETPSATERPGAETAAPAALYRSHSPPQINQRSSAQLQQLKHALATQGSKLAAAKQQQQQFQQNVLMGNGDLSGRDENRYGRGFSRQQQQQQQAMFEQQVHGGHLVAPQGFPPPAMYNKQRPHAPAGYFPPNGSNQALHLAGVPPAAMNYGHHHHHPHPGFSGGFAVPNEVFMAGEHPASAAENRWSGREQPPSQPPPHVAGVPGLYQQQPMYGMNKLGYP